MFSSNALVSEYSADSPAPAALTMIATRFGALAYDPDDTIEMPRGMPGFAGQQTFAFAQLADPNHATLRVMQSLSDPAVSFLVAPVELGDGLYGPKDVAEACAAAGAASEDLAIVVVVSVRRHAGMIHVSANLRAPILIDTRTKRAIQYVLPNSELSVRHAISTVQIAAEPAAVK